VDVRSDGSGTVAVGIALDAEAVQSAEEGGGKLEQRVRLSDLAGAGWTVGAWRRAGDGSASIELSKSFTRVEQVSGLAAELRGAAGPVRGFRAARAGHFLSTTYTIRGTIDLTQLKTGISTDPDLVARLSGQKVDVPALDQAILAQLRKALTLKVTV